MKFRSTLALLVLMISVAVAIYFRGEISRKAPSLKLDPTLGVFDSKAIGYVDRPTATRHRSIAPLDDRDAFLAWRDEKRRQLTQIFEVPDRDIDPKVRTLNSETLPSGVTRESLEFESFDGSMIPAVLHYAPDSVAQPAILLVPGHSKPHESGLQQLVVDHDSYQHAAAAALAEKGYVTLAIELRGFGILGAALGTEHRLVAYNAIMAGDFYKKIVVTDALYAAAVLRRAANIDESRVGVAGVSLGGELAALLGALVPEFKAIYFAGYGGVAGPFPLGRGERDDQPHYCHIIPGSGKFLRRETAALLLAPRAVLVNRGSRENPPGAEYLKIMEQAWSLLGVPGNYEFTVVPDVGHEFVVEQAITFFNANL